MQYGLWVFLETVWTHYLMVEVYYFLVSVLGFVCAVLALHDALAFGCQISRCRRCEISQSARSTELNLILKMSEFCMLYILYSLATSFITLVRSLAAVV